MKFANLKLIEPILRAVSSEGYDVATPIQAQAIPHILEGKDVLGSAQTGTGKTAAFALPILQRLTEKTVQHAPRKMRCLVLAPTRELALQIAESFSTYGKNLPLRNTVIFGGVNQKSQTNAMRNGIDILVATPGRLLDLMNQRFVDVRGVEILVLDEADRMLDMGFIHDIRKVVAQIPAERQTLFFSATMPSEIRQLANSLLRHPVTVQVANVAKTTEAIAESVYFVEKKNKPLLLAHLFEELPMSRAIVFTRTKHGADRVVRQLHTKGIRAEAIHGNKSQNARERALQSFRVGKTPILVATDIASRGIDVEGISHVVNYDLTHEPETYVHRIGRTARAGALGAAVSFCDRDEMANLKAIEKLIQRKIEVKKDHPTYPASDAAANNGQKTERHSNAHAEPKAHVHHPRSAHQNHQTHQAHRTHQGPRSNQGHRSSAGDGSGTQQRTAPSHRHVTTGGASGAANGNRAHQPQHAAAHTSGAKPHAPRRAHPASQHRTGGGARSHATSGRRRPF